jgi:hypothetical protein
MLKQLKYKLNTCILPEEFTYVELNVKCFL